MINGAQATADVCAVTAGDRRPPDTAHTYDAIIRTCNSLETAKASVSSLRSQSLAPSNIIIVDSGSNPDQRAGLVALADRFIDVSDRPFNYSYSINVALPEVSSSHALIISSHTWLVDERVAEDLMRSMDDPDCAAAWLSREAGRGEWEQTKVTASNFNSTNGLSNRCALIPVARLKTLAFREDVFACEDQVWAKSVFDDGFSYTMCIDTERWHSAPPKAVLTKWANEQVALAYYVDPRLMGARCILRRVATGLVYACRLKWDSAWIRFVVAYRLIKARSERPTHQSKYY